MIEQKKNFYIDGQWVKPSKSNDFEVIDPSTEEICAIISLGSESDTNDAVNAAKKSFFAGSRKSIFCPKGFFPIINNSKGLMGEPGDSGIPGV